jgi:hypothetical protein
MIDKIEFSDAKQVRKSLLITSFIGIAFQALVQHSTGNIEFLGFKIPVADAGVIPSFIGYLVAYFIIALLIRYNDENLRTKYKEYVEYLKLKTHGERENYEKAKSELYPSNFKIKLIRASIVLIDIFFPILFGLFTLYRIFWK